MDIIFYNDKYPDWFKPCLDSVKMNSPSCQLHFLDDGMFKTECDLFDKSFVNKSSNPAYFEKACIKRWLVINEYIKKNGIKRFLVMDWDILVFCDLEKEAGRFKDYDFTYMNFTSIGFSFWNNPAALQDLCDSIVQAYSNPESGIAKTIDVIWQDFQIKKMEGGICDMTFAHQLIHSGDKYKTIDVYQIFPDNVCFDCNMIMGWDGWRTRDNIKRITWENKMAYCFNEKLDRNVRMMVLHFAGHSRTKIFDYWEGYRCSL